MNKMPFTHLAGLLVVGLAMTGCDQTKQNRLGTTGLPTAGGSRQGSFLHPTGNTAPTAGMNGRSSGVYQTSHQQRTGQQVPYPANGTAYQRGATPGMPTSGMNAGGANMSPNAVSFQSPMPPTAASNYPMPPPPPPNSFGHSTRNPSQSLGNQYQHNSNYAPPSSYGTRFGGSRGSSGLPPLSR